ncbi:MAG: hypothetical protein P4L53_13670 [Candidatus Obscuribacterales bacterium]|nr:hypothetical protein [Candidatus Obscuribacterales bacterium]
MATENPSLRLGDLLTSAGLLKPTDLREAMMIARQQQLPVGRVLIMNGYLSEGQLQSAVQAQSMVKDSIIDLDTAVEALDLVATEHITLDESLIRMGWTMNTQVITNKLGEFLVEAELVAPADIHYALEQCREIGLPLGRVLVVTGYLTEEMLTNSLNAQVLVRDGRLSREQAVHGLRAALERQITLEESLQQTGIVHAPNATRMRLGELLLGAGLIDDASLMNAVEIGLVSEKLIGQVLLEKGTLSPEGLDNALVLQNMVAQGELYAQDAINALRKSIQSQISAMDALNSLHEPAPGPVPLAEPLGLYQFLQLGGLITPQDVEQAMHTSARDTNLMGQMLLFAGIMPGYMVDASKEALELINRGALTIEQGMIALKACFSSGSTLQDAFRELNWEFQQGAPIQAHTEAAPQANFTPAISQSQSGGYPAGNQPAPPQAVPEPQYQSGQQHAVPMPQYQSGQQQTVPGEVTRGAYQAVPQYAQNSPAHNTTSGSYAPAQQHTQSGAYQPLQQPATNVPQAQQSQSNSQPVVQQPMQQQPMQQQQPYAQQNASGAQPTLAPAPAPAPQQSQWTQSQSGAQQNPPQSSAPVADTPMTAPPQPAQVQPVISVPRVDQAVNPWAAKTQAPAISSVSSAPSQNVQPNQNAPAQTYQQPAPPEPVVQPMPEVQTAPPPPAPAPPAPPEAPHPVAPAPAEEAAPPKRKRLNDLMPKSKK